MANASQVVVPGGAAQQVLEQPLPSILPENVADGIRSFTHLMPGVPWTRLMMEEMYEEVKISGFRKEIKVEGFRKVMVWIHRYRLREKKEDVFHLKATLSVYSGVNDIGDHEMPLEVRRGEFHDSPQGLHRAFDYLQEGANKIKRRGLCPYCLENEERPQKRFRLTNNMLICGACALQLYTEPRD